MTRTPIMLSADFGFPLDLLTESVAILAKRRVGKSYTARKLVEALFGAGQQVVIVDPKGDWWGVRSSADGKRPGLAIVIVGGEHADIPLEPSGGELVARLVVEQRASVLLDLSQLRKSAVAVFMTAFLETLYRLKAQEQYRTAMMLVIDEADAIAPQKPFKGEERMLGAAEDIVRRGGQRGIGVTLVSQRAAVLNKNVLTQCGVLMLLRTTGSQDIDAVDEWIKKHGQPERRALVMAEIGTLPRGVVHVWAPGWPDEEGIFRRVAVAPISTFDSGATPTAGQVRQAPKTIADVDLTAFRADMAATIARVEADDPKKLRARIEELERASRKPATVATPVTVLKRVEVPVLKAGQLERVERVVERAEALAKDYLEHANGLRIALQLLRVPAETPAAPPAPVAFQRVPRLEVIDVDARDRVAVHLPGQRGGKTLARATAIATAITTDAGPLELRGPHRKMLNELATWHDLGVVSIEKQQFCLLCGYGHVRTGGFAEPLRDLTRAGLVQTTANGQLALTADGAAHANPNAPPSSSSELQARLLERLSNPEKRVAQQLLAVYPGGMTKEALCSALGYTHVRTGGFAEPLRAVIRLGLAELVDGHVVATDRWLLPSER